MKKKEHHATEMYQLVEQWKASTLNKQEFCRHHQVSTHSLGYWVTKYNKSQASPNPRDVGTEGFLPIEIGGQPGEVQAFHINFPNGVSVVCPAACDMSQVKQLIQLF